MTSLKQRFNNSKTKSKKSYDKDRERDRKRKEREWAKKKRRIDEIDNDTYVDKSRREYRRRRNNEVL
jgi:hypothetical protein